MNAKDVIKYGHGEVVKAVEGLRNEDWDKVGVTTSWSIKDVISHLVSYEYLLTDVVNSVVSPQAPTPALDQYKADYENFNSQQVGARKDKPFKEVFDEYVTAQAKTATLIAGVAPELLAKAGTIPWYGVEYSLDDYIVYTNYGHKKEHSAQIKVFRRGLEK